LVASAGPRGRAFALLAAVALAALTVAPAAQAQQPQPKAPAKGAAKSAPAAPAAPAAAPGAQPAPAAEIPQLIYSPWTKFCLKPPEGNGKQICFIGKDGRIESGQPVIAGAIIEPDGEPKKIFRFTLPLGVILTYGTRIIVDDNAPLQSPFSVCFANGCISDYEATPEMIAQMKKGKTLFVQAFQANGSSVTLPLPLGDFAKAYDGPPTDPKQIEENQKKLQEELQKRAEEQRKKLEAQQAPAPAAK
jgi:invasion protein IalB